MKIFQVVAHGLDATKPQHSSFLPMAQQTLGSQNLLIVEASNSRSKKTPQSVGLLWASDQLVADTSTWQHTTRTRDRRPCPPTGFEPTISAGERPQTHALYRAATGTGLFFLIKNSLIPRLFPTPEQAGNVERVCHRIVKWQLKCTPVDAVGT